MAGESFSKVLLFHWRPGEDGPLRKTLRRAGYQAVYNPEPRAPKLSEIEKAGFAAAVIDLSRLPSHGRYVAA